MRGDCSTCARNPELGHVRVECRAEEECYHLPIIDPDTMTPEQFRLWAVKEGTLCWHGSEDRWKERASRGQTDDELRAALKFEFGEWHSRSAPGRPTVECRRGKLEVVVTGRAWNAKPLLVLRGAE